MKKLGFLLVLAFVLRVALIPVARHGDMNNNTSWGQLLLSRGPVNFYEGTTWTYSSPNQPPLYLLTFASTAVIQNSSYNFIHWANDNIQAFPSKIIWWFDTYGELYIAKLPGIFADLGIGFVIYKFFQKEKKTALLLSALWLVNPISWYNSSIWGGTDSIVNLLGVVSILLLLRKRISLSAVFFTLSVLFKGSLLLFIPVWLFVALRTKSRKDEWIKALAYSLIAFLAVTFSFHPYLDLPVWFFNLYTNTFLPGEIGSLTANAFNLWWIVDPGKTLDSTIYFGLSARIWGILITLLSFTGIFYKLIKKHEDKNVFLSLAFIALASFLFMTRIHERYLYPFFPFATLALPYFNWLFIPYLILSLTSLFNLYHLFWAPGIPVVEAWYTNPAFMISLSAINLLIFGYLAVRLSTATSK